MLLCVRALLTLLGIYSLGVNSHELTSLVKFNNDTFALLKYHGEELSHCELVMVNSREAGSEENIMGELSKKTKVINVLFEAMMDTIQECESLQNKTKSHQKEYSSWSSITSIFKIFSGLSPGTNWCGLGDVAENYFDLGRNFYEDKCCVPNDILYTRITDPIASLNPAEHPLLWQRLSILAVKWEAGSEENIMGELSKKTKVINVLFEAMMDTIQECESLQNKTKSHQKEYSSWSSITSIFKIFSGLSPGTNWCGLGDVAENYFDLGRNFYEDKCCRAHDHCPIKIDSKATRFGLKNRGSYTKSHCRCDDVFYECLKSVNTSKAYEVGHKYFEILSPVCLNSCGSHFFFQEQEHEM